VLDWMRACGGHDPRRHRTGVQFDRIGR
jgi:hypothetical protein